MNILSIETATSACAIGLRRHDGEEIVRVLDTDRRHTEALTPGIADALATLSLRPADITRVVIDVGPGLFTGLRVGIATAIAFAQAVGAELVSVTSLELLAAAVWRRGVRGAVVVAIDGRRGEVFTQSFDLGEEVTPRDTPQVTTARTCVITWATDGIPVTFVGDGVTRYRRDFDAVPNGTVIELDVPDQHEALTIGAGREPVDQVVPLYLRDADAVANFSTRDRS
jgi:tRNA threonylcarbamoyl adenosine modification protein YeaZ